MRISSDYQQKIKQCADDIFGKNTQVMLFGSRTDDSKKGGDIDLYIKTCKRLSALDKFDKKIAFISKLHQAIDEQKIDVVITGGKIQEIEQIALKTGIIL